MLMKRTCLNLITFTSILAVILLFNIASAALPNLTNPIEPRLYEGSAEDITAFIKEKEKEVNALKKEIKEIISSTTNDQDRRTLSDALDFLQALTILCIKLQSQIKAPTSLAIKLPAIGSPPYELKVFYELTELMGKVDKRLGEYEPKVSLNERDLESMQDELKSLFSEYIVLKQSVPPKPEAYLKLGQIYTLQIKYAIVRLQLSRSKRIIDEAQKLKEQLNGLLKTTFKHLKITPKDVQDAKEAYEKISSQMNKELVSLGKQAVRLNKKIVPYEIKLTEVLAKLREAKPSDPAVSVLQARRRYYEAAIEANQAMLEAINQRKLKWKLVNVESQFRYDWISTYSGVKGSKPIKEFIKKWYSMLEQVENTTESLRQQIIDVRSQEFDIMRKLTLLSDKRAATEDATLARTLLSAYKKLKEANNAVDELFVAVSKNIEFASALGKKVELVLGLMKEKAGIVANVRVWGTRNLKKTWEDIKVVLYYPLVTIGNSSITLSSILKVILLLTVGIYVLRKGRKKLNEVLVKKTQLAPGTIGSITTLIYYTFLVLVVLIALSTAGINMNQLSIILGGLGVGIGFGLQTIANNFISGLILLIDRSVKVGDFVRLEDGLVGEVKNVAIRYTVVRTQDGEDIIVPNSEFVSQRVRNWTYGDNWRRLKIPFGVSYDSDPDQVVKLAIEAAREVHSTVEDYRHPISVRFEGFGDNSLNFFLRVWCRMKELKGDYGYISDYYFALFRKFKGAGIEIPFPQRDINIKTISPELLEKLSK